MLMFSILLVFGGHNYPGGGFIGALVATSAIALYTLAFNLKSSGFDLWDPRIIALGILCFLFSFLFPMLFNKETLTGFWATL
jgi:multicomponent Na+:H+ antiporter subunit B